MLRHDLRGAKKGRSHETRGFAELGDLLATPFLEGASPARRRPVPALFLIHSAGRF